MPITAQIYIFYDSLEIRVFKNAGIIQQIDIFFIFIYIPVKVKP